MNQVRLLATTQLTYEEYIERILKPHWEEREEKIQEAENPSPDCPNCGGDPRIGCHPNCIEPMYTIKLSPNIAKA